MVCILSSVYGVASFHAHINKVIRNIRLEDIHASSTVLTVQILLTSNFRMTGETLIIISKLGLR